MRYIEELINRQLNRWESEKKAREEKIENGESVTVEPIITVSRQKGSRGSYLAELIAQKLGYQRLHREIIDEICKLSGYRKRVVESLDAKVRSRIELMIEGAFKGKYVDASDYFRNLYKVIMSISEHGGIVVVGRASNFILGQDHGFHIRVVASRSARIGNLAKYQEISTEEAERLIVQSDIDREKFVYANFKQSINDPLAYDLIINTTYIDIENALEISLASIRSKTEVLLSTTGKG